MRTQVALAIVLAFGLSLTASPVLAGRDAQAKPSAKAAKLDKKAASEDTDRAADPVKAAQRSLQAKGYDPGDVDGRLGPRTRSAIRSFQKAEGLLVTGRLDTTTMDRFRADERSDKASASPNTGLESFKPGPEKK